MYRLSLVDKNNEYIEWLLLSVSCMVDWSFGLQRLEMLLLSASEWISATSLRWRFWNFIGFWRFCRMHLSYFWLEVHQKRITSFKLQHICNYKHQQIVNESSGIGLFPDFDEKLNQQTVKLNYGILRLRKVFKHISLLSYYNINNKQHAKLDHCRYTKDCLWRLFSSEAFALPDRSSAFPQI